MSIDVFAPARMSMSLQIDSIPCNLLLAFTSMRIIRKIPFFRP